MSGNRTPPSPETADQPTKPVVFYNYDGVTVTTRHYAARGYRYDVLELTDFAQARGSQHPGVVIGLVIAAAEAVVATMIVKAIPSSPLVWAAAFVALLIPCLVGLVCARRWPPQLELRARYRGQPVALLVTRNELEFQRVVRALRRASEAANRWTWTD